MTWRSPSTTTAPTGEILFQTGYTTDGVFSPTSGSKEIRKWYNTSTGGITYQEYIPPNYNYLVGATGTFGSGDYRQGYYYSEDGSSWTAGGSVTEESIQTVAAGRTDGGCFWATQNNLYIVSGSGFITTIPKATIFGSSLNIYRVTYQNSRYFATSFASTTIGWSDDGGATWNQATIPAPTGLNTYEKTGIIIWTGSTYRVSFVVGDGVFSQYGARWDWDLSSFSNFTEDSGSIGMIDPLMSWANGNYFISNGTDFSSGTNGYQYPNSNSATVSYVSDSIAFFAQKTQYLEYLLTSGQGAGDLWSDAAGTFISSDIDANEVWSAADSQNTSGRVLFTNQGASGCDVLYTDDGSTAVSAATNVCPSTLGVIIL